MKFEEWVRTVPPEITNDALWHMTVYRQALFLSDLTWVDVCKLHNDSRTIRLSDQLYRAVGSIGANLAEGFSYASKKEQARYYEYALGSAREARHWYYQSKYLLGEDVIIHRNQLIIHIIRQLLKMVPTIRDRKIRESTIAYELHPLENLLNNIPFPEE